MAESAARFAVVEWLQGLDREHMHLFEVDGVECALECFTGHWGTEARWRWDRTAAGDPDEDDSGEDILLDVALGRKVAPRQQKARRQAKLPPYAEGDLSEDDIKSCALARARENLGKLALHRMG